MTLRHRPRLLIGVAAALVAYLVAWPIEFRQATHILIAWNVGALTFLALLAQMMVSENGRRHLDATAEDEGQTALLSLSILAATAAIGAIVWELGPVKSMEGFVKAAHLALVTVTVLTAWAFIHASFAVHYAGAYFAPNGESAAGGLNFPGCDKPGWPEFVYQAFVVGCAFATADVNVTTTTMRGIVITQGVLAFLFNTVILALTINIAAGLF